MAVLPVVSLCAGAGGLERGLASALGPGTVRPLLYVEREAFAVAALVAAMEAGCVDPAPVWSDLTTLPGAVLGPLRRLARRQVLAVAAGFPCQPHSRSGRRQGTADERWIWPEIGRILRLVRPSVILLENVPGLTADGFDVVLGTMAALGLDAEWGVFRADEVGAPHIRERLFVLAADQRGRRYLAGQRLALTGVGSVADADRQPFRLQPRRSGGKGRSEAAISGGIGKDLADAPGVRQREGRSGRAGEQGGSDDLSSGARSLFPPAPDDLSGWLAVLEQYPSLVPALNSTEIESALCALADGLDLAPAGRPEWIRLAGNGVVPQQAALAVRELAARLIGAE